MEGGFESQWFGDDIDSASRRAAASSVAATAARVVTAKPFPGVAIRIRTMAADPSGSVIRVARVLEGDPALCARLLRLVNSAGYALRIKCSSVRQAVALAGLDNVRDLVTSASVLKLFDARTRQTAAVLGHCAQVGSICRYLGALLSLPRETLFTCGFMHDIGKLMLLEVQEDDYQALLESCADEAEATYAAEYLAYGYDHATLGAAVLAKWRIPEPIPSVVEHHHDYAGVLHRAEVAQMVAVVRLADSIAHLLSQGAEGPSDWVCDSAEVDYLGISRPQLSAIWPDLRTLWQRTRVLVEEGRTELLECDSLAPTRRNSVAQAKETVPEGLDEVPVTYPCHICAQATFGDTCPICGAHVCSVHGNFREGWCVACASRFSDFQQRSSRLLPLRVAIAMCLAVAALITASLFMSGPTTIEDFLGCGLLVTLVAVITATAHRSLTRTRFVRSRGALGTEGREGASSVVAGVALVSTSTQLPR